MEVYGTRCNFSTTVVLSNTNEQIFFFFLELHKKMGSPGDQK